MAEQVASFLGRGSKRGETPTSVSKNNGHEKRRVARQRRRAEVRDPENAPSRVIRGWAD
jgi:hypothetical protein